VFDATVVVVEDDEPVGRSLVKALINHGITADWVGSGEEASRRVTSCTELVLLDLGLPDVDGVETCRLLRQRHPKLQILIVSARGDEIDVVVGLDAGADDYLIKPFGVGELLARVRAAIRRLRVDRSDVLSIGNLRMDIAARKSWVGDDPLDLRVKEFDLLAALAADAGRVVSRRRLLADLWDQHFENTSKTLDMHISAVRRKLGQFDPAPRITTVRGVGYRLEGSDA
jgi:DNA-binding response OmpR family regulator